MSYSLHQNDILTSAQNVYWHHDWQYIFLAYITRDRKSLGQTNDVNYTIISTQNEHSAYGCVNKNNLCFVTTITMTTTVKRGSAPIPFSLIYLLGMDVHACVCSHNNNRTFFLRIINIYHLSERSITVFSRTIEFVSIERSTNNNKIIMLHCNLPVAILWK